MCSLLFFHKKVTTLHVKKYSSGFPGSSDSKKSTCNAETWVQPQVAKIQWRRQWLPTPVIFNHNWTIEIPREFQKNTYFWFIYYTKAFDYMDHKNLWKILQEMEISDYLTKSWEICMQVKKQ